MELLIRVIGVRGLLAIIFSIGVVTLTIMGLPIPSEMYALLGLIIGFYFGGRNSVNGAIHALRAKKKVSTRRK